MLPDFATPKPSLQPMETKAKVVSLLDNFVKDKPISKEEMIRMYEWYNQTRQLTDPNLANKLPPGQPALGLNFTFEEFVQIVRENRQQLHWFGAPVEALLTTLYLLIIIFGICANGIICYTVVRKSKLRTVRNMFIMNLAISDLIMCIFCMPLTLVQLLLKNWMLGDFMCRVVPFLQAVNVFASTMTITAIALDRYQVIVYPASIDDRRKKRVALLVTLVIWVVSAVVGMPLAVYSRLDDREYIHFVSYRMCMEEWPSTTLRAVYAGVIMLLQFVVPVVVLIVIHWKICNFLKTRILQNPTTPMEMNRAMKEAKRHRKNSTLLMAIAIMFALCWFPLTLLNLLADLNYFIFMYKNFLLAFAVAHLFAMISACLNPIVYGWFNMNFRKEVLRIVCCQRDEEGSDAEIEKRRLVRAATARDADGGDDSEGGRAETRRAVRAPERQRIACKNGITYKAMHTQTVQPVLVRQDSPMTLKDSLESSSSR